MTNWPSVQVIYDSGLNTSAASLQIRLTLLSSTVGTSCKNSKKNLKNLKNKRP